MKLRNKKTGDIKDYCSVAIFVNASDDKTAGEYYTIKDLNENWEDYIPSEPLIKDEKVRNAVRAWAEANGARRVYIVDLGMLRDESTGNEIKFNGEPFVGQVTALKTITELCGEEEEWEAII